jgi:hypothetical protein
MHNTNNLFIELRAYVGILVLQSGSVGIALNKLHIE